MIDFICLLFGESFFDERFLKPDYSVEGTFMVGEAYVSPAGFEYDILIVKGEGISDIDGKRYRDLYIRQAHVERPISLGSVVAVYVKDDDSGAMLPVGRSTIVACG